MDRRKVFWYFVLPMLLSGTMLAMYFSGVRVLESIVSAPYLEAVAGDSRREYGLLENLQHAMLLAVVVLAVRSVIRHRVLAVRVFMGFVAAFVTLMFLEEIDYGLHYYELLTGVPHDEIAERRNLHNVGNRTAALKSISTAGTIALFGVAPFVFGHSKNRWVRYFTPDRYAALMLVVAFLTRSIAHDLHSRGMGYGLDGNLSEFRELVTYYMGLAYTVYLVRRSPHEYDTANEAE